MQKEEFPTFLNEQPTIIFGRTGRELMIIAGGLTAGFALWDKLQVLQHTSGGFILSLTLVALVVIASLVVALLSIAGRPVEEWIFILLFYIGMPKLYLYTPLEEEENLKRSEEKVVEKRESLVANPYDEDETL